DAVPSWDGNTDKLAQWITRLNDIADRSPTIRVQLGSVASDRFTDRAQQWWCSLSVLDRQKFRASWDNLRDAVGEYWMNLAWVDKTREQARRARYRDYKHPEETPSDYFMRKKELYDLVHNVTEIELIRAIMRGAPQEWSPLLQDHKITSILELQKLIAQLEDKLLSLD
ncbi:hypothetical protein K474DRAFT_1567841, partial [Panus rudis PR-1116 ss-1]